MIFIMSVVVWVRRVVESGGVSKTSLRSRLDMGPEIRQH